MHKISVEIPPKTHRYAQKKTKLELSLTVGATCVTTPLS